MADVNPLFSIVMPAYNEAAHLEQNIQETLAFMDTLSQRYEIIVVDDCSTDHTAEILRRMGQKHCCVREVILPKNMGKGNALKAGFKVSRGELVLFLDADLELHPNQLPLFLQIMEQSKVEVVIGSKRHPQSELHYPVNRRIMSTVYFWLVKWMFGLPIRDTQTGIKLFRRNVLTLALPRMLVKQYAFDLELLVIAHHHRFRIAEAPVVVHFKEQYSHVHLQDVFNIWWDTMAVFYRLHILHYYDREPKGPDDTLPTQTSCP